MTSMRPPRARAVATRYDKLAVRYEATVCIAAINEWLLPTYETRPSPLRSAMVSCPAMTARWRGWRGRW